MRAVSNGIVVVVEEEAEASEGGTGWGVLALVQTWYGTELKKYITVSFEERRKSFV